MRNVGETLAVYIHEVHTRDMNTAATEYGTAVQFADVKVGDTISFLRRDTGFGGDGIVDRKGTVAKVTAKTVVVESRAGYSTTRYILRASDWYSASPRRWND